MQRLLFCFALASTLGSSCIEKNFDVPPLDGDTVSIEANATLADLKEFFEPGAFVEITDSLVVDAIIVADDEAGNFYKKLVLQDETGGIEIQLNQTDLYTSYEEGRLVYVNAQGLFISDYNGLIQIGGAPIIGTNGRQQLGRVEAALIEDILLRGELVGLPDVQERSITALGPTDLSTLVRVCDIQFTPSDTAGTLADPVAQTTLNRTVEDCDQNTLIVRTSGFADLAMTSVPDCGGCLTGIYSVFSDDKQVFLRDEADLDFDGPRCDGTACGEVGTIGDTITTQQLRSLGGGAGIPADRGMRVVVISDRTTGTTNAQNLVVQGADGYGIILRFTEPHNFNLGDEIFVNISGRTLSTFNGGLQISDLPLSVAVLLSSSQQPAAQLVTVSEILSDLERYESTLVQLSDVEFSAGGADWAAGVVATDGSGNIDVFTFSSASFAGETPPDSANTLVAVVSDYNGPQLILRSLNDLDGTSGSGNGGGSGSNDPVSMFTVDFQGLRDYDPVDIMNWSNYTAIDQGRVWQAREFDGNVYAQATAFRDENAGMDTWLVTPPLDLSESLSISFETATSFNVHDGLAVLISTDYTGTGDPAASSWTSIAANLADGASGDNTWIPSDDIDLSQYQGTGYIAFRYTGSGGSNTSTFRVDNIVLRPQ